VHLYPTGQGLLKIQLFVQLSSEKTGDNTENIKYMINDIQRYSMVQRENVFEYVQQGDK
jgi:hypothetical protein